jgi:hypothetical protein
MVSVMTVPSKRIAMLESSLPANTFPYPLFLKKVQASVKTMKQYLFVKSNGIGRFLNPRKEHPPNRFRLEAKTFCLNGQSGYGCEKESGKKRVNKLSPFK